MDPALLMLICPRLTDMTSNLATSCDLWAPVASSWKDLPPAVSNIAPKEALLGGELRRKTIQHFV